ncbi:type IV pili methyl-accepting chemotaxis transducer N-terminal domain-containing protein [Croceitalea rosinachiae]|uniref:Type IV pili methyl-accepting chemotaxis transducer N-terminal domain-containing protein n=1 Tax=Croceitalea rosinachiae TaxID=3075596 RepID=A0ABU3AAK7_9FLAO|nr:type IV pili methyl-accepting chemotaxis transducer N-terminal domain-containing protein [Croceitalea sp. F388]MDT0607221.1 type IV pili methyl-accepting chemotaxis transducer N-terminal domain-containing protein [Croceitalea sp. F388]
MKIGKKKVFKKGFRAYYLLVVSIIVLTIAIQSIIQYSLNEQRSTAKIVNLAGRQRMLSQRLLNEVYSCRYHNCDYAELKLTLNKLYQMNAALQEGSYNLGIDPLDNEGISANFERLEPYVNWFKWNLSDLQDIDDIKFNDMRYRVDRFTIIMNEIVLQFQKKSEEDIKGMRIIEMELAIFSVLIVLFEIFFIVNPIINRIMKQKKKLEEIAWHQSHVFGSHIKNIKDLQYVLKVEKIPERQQEILKFISEELDKLKEVSNNMVKALKKNDETEMPHHAVIKKVEGLLEKYSIMPSEEFIDGDKAHS